jgi:hypothetical protein
MAFQDALSECGLTDLGYIGDKFTWHRGGTRERLDRALPCDDWRLKFPDVVVENLVGDMSERQ